MSEADTSYDQLDAIAVTQGPGLIGSLLVGINFAKGLALGDGQAAVWALTTWKGMSIRFGWRPAKNPITFRVIVLIVSGGHSELVLMTDHGEYQRLGSTIDDAAGEAFDKVGRLLGLPYPGGPAIERAARCGDIRAYNFPRAKTR